MTGPIVFIVDDDAGIRYSIAFLLEANKLTCRSYVSAEEFLAACEPGQAGCLLLDVRMPGMDGPALQMELARRGIRLPIIFLTAFADLGTGIEAMKRGALDFLTKPVNGADLLQRVRAAIELDRCWRMVEHRRKAFSMRLEKLSPREYRVLSLAMSGLKNDEISIRLKISQRTTEGHRSRICLKTGVNSLAELVQQAAAAGFAMNVFAPGADEAG